MPSIELLKQYTTAERDYVEVTNSSPNPDNAMLVAPLVFLLMAGIVTVHKIKLLHQVNPSQHIALSPCQNCRFFADNQYIKCAVHPDTVLTKAANNCRDYYPQIRKFFLC